MLELTTADHIWNRACAGGGAASAVGDRALADLLAFHSIAMNGGVLHALEFHAVPALVAAEAGYRFFGLAPVANLISEARQQLDGSCDPEELEATLDEEYETLVPSDALLLQLFEIHLREYPNHFSPLDA